MQFWWKSSGARGAGVALLCLVSAMTAQADQLIFQRGDALFIASEDDKGMLSPPIRRLMTMGLAGETQWAISPDGRRVVWLTRGNTGPKKTGTESEPALGLIANPAVVFVSDLSGRHTKRLLTTADLRDRLGRSVQRVGAGGDKNGFDQWEPVSLAYSADGRTLYLSCIALGDAGGKATFGVDAGSGYAVVDADDHWRSLAEVTFLDARGGLLAGSGLARFTVSTEPDTPQRYAPVTIVNLAEGTRTPLYAASGEGSKLPEYATVTYCLLSPDSRTVAFVAANRGLWTVDIKTRTYHRLVEGAALRPQWSQDGKRLRFLLPRLTAEGSTEPVIYDLYEVPTADSATIIPRLVLQNVDAFALAPD